MEHGSEDILARAEAVLADSLLESSLTGISSAGEKRKEENAQYGHEEADEETQTGQ
jgi:hypothetical protein